MRFCTACGTPVSGTRSYCTHCGAGIRRTADPSLAADRHLAADPHLAAAQVGAAYSEQPQRASAPPASLGTTQATTAALAAAPPATPGPPAITLPSTWLADFDQPPEAPASTEPAALPTAAPASGRTLLAVAVVAVLIAAGSAAWMAGSGRPRAGRPQAGRHPAAASGVSPRSSRQLARPAQPTSPRPSSSTLTPIPSSRRGIVSVSRPLAQRADAQQVAGFLDSYFAAVNHREYLEYSSLFDRWHHLTRAEFDRGYRTTHDSSAVLTGLTSSRDSLTATVTFTSHQSPAASPNHATCTNWRIVLYLRRTGGVYLIGPPPPGYHATYHGCG
jgi:hypothetical protein